MYLPYLQVRRKRFEPGQRNLKIGDLVLVTDIDSERLFYNKAIVVETIPSSDGNVRKVKIKLANGKIFLRPISKIVLIKTSEDLSNSDDKYE